MKNETLIRAIGTIDDELIARAQRHNPASCEKVPSNRRLRCKSMRLMASIAAVLLIGATICFAGGVFDGFFHHFSSGGDIDRYADYITSTIASASNEDLEIGIAGAVMDPHQCLLVFTVRALSDVGVDIVNQEGRQLLDSLELKAVLADGTTTQPNFDAGYHKGARNKSAAWSSYVLTIRPTEMESKTIETIHIDFSGLSMELDMQGYVMESVALYSDDTNALKVVEMSPIGIYVEIPVMDTDPKALRELSASIKMIPIMADGTLADAYSLHGGSFYNEEKHILQSYMSFSMVEDATLKTEITDLSIYSGLQINGINYFFVGT